MATPVGAATLTSISRNWVLPEITDNVYASNAAIFRLIQANKRMVQGGTQIEVPLMYSRFAAGGSYRGYDQLTIAPSDTVKNAALDWKQYYVPLAVSSLDLIKANSAEAIANLITMQSQQAQMEMAELLGTGLWQDPATDPKGIDGLKGAIDDGSVATTYAGLLRSANLWWKSKLDSSTSALTLASLQSMFGLCTAGGQSPTVIYSRQEQYNRYWALNVLQQRFPSQPSGSDTQLAAGGFTNVTFNNVPWIVDSHVFDGPNSSNSSIVFVNEDFVYLIVNNLADFRMEEWQKPPDQDAYVSTILWAGNVALSNDARHGKMTNLSS